MDTSFWIQCNPKITVEHTTKKYFGKYLYKIVVYCPAGRLIDGKRDMVDELKHRKEITRHINQSGYWGLRQSRDLDHADVEFLDVLREIRRNPNGIKLRIEEPRVQIYAGDENELIHLVTNQLKPFVKHIELVSGPANDECADLLNSGAIIRKTDIGYTHKVILRDGRYGNDVKTNILTYLEQLDLSVAKVPAGGYDTLKRNSGFVWNLYFYTNDPSVTIFLNLIHPGLVLNIHELVVTPHK